MTTSLPARRDASSALFGKLDCTRGPVVIGITSQRLVGLTTVGDYLSKLGVPVLDMDQITSDLIDRPGPAQEAILRRFGRTLAGPGGQISHLGLASIVSHSQTARNDLESILYTRILENMRSRIDALTGQPVVAVLVPMLHEGGWTDQFDENWCVYCKESVIFARCALNGIPEDKARVYMSTQLPQDVKVSLSDYVIDNSGSRKETYAAVEKTLREAYQRALEEPSECEPDHDECDESLRLKQWLDEFGKLGISDILARLGDIAHVGQLAGSSTSTMRVDATSLAGDVTARKLEVMVTMSVSNSEGSSGLPDRVTTCRCGPKCKNGCKCKDGCDCGCSRKAPPANPTEPPAPDGDGGKVDRKPKALWVNRVAIIAILVLTCAGLLSLPAMNSGPGHEVQIVDRTTTKVVVVERTSPSPDILPGNGSCRAGSPVQLAEPPGRSFHYMPNAARRLVAIWEASFPSDCKGSSLRGLDSEGRLIIWQLHSDPYFTSLLYQYIVNYQLGSTIQVDRYQGISNTFAGRTIYSNYQGSRATIIERVDERQRPIARVEWTTSTSIRVTEYDIYSGRVTREYTLFDSDAQSYVLNAFYLYSLFSQ